MIRRRRREVTRQIDELRSGERPLDDCCPEAASLLGIATHIDLHESERLSPRARERGRRQVLAAITAQAERSSRGYSPRAWLRISALAGGLLALLSGGAIAAAQSAPPNSLLYPVREVTQRLVELNPLRGSSPSLHQSNQPLAATPLPLEQSAGTSAQMQESELRALGPGPADQQSAGATRDAVVTASDPSPAGTAPGNSANAPGHAAPGAAPGNSANAPGHNAVAASAPAPKK